MEILEIILILIWIANLNYAQDLTVSLNTTMQPENITNEASNITTMVQSDDSYDISALSYDMYGTVNMDLATINTTEKNFTFTVTPRPEEVGKWDDVLIKDYPFLVAIVNYPTASALYRCTGVIITMEWVLAPSSCFDGNDDDVLENLRIQWGVTVSNGNDKRNYIGIKDIVYYEQPSEKLAHSLVLLQLRKLIPETKVSQPAHLPNPLWDVQSLFEHDQPCQELIYMHENLTHFKEGAERTMVYINEYLTQIKSQASKEDLEKLEKDYKAFSKNHFDMLREDPNVKLKRLNTSLLQIMDCLEQWDILDPIQVLCTEGAPHNFDFNCGNYLLFDVVDKHTGTPWVQLTLWPVEWNGVLVCNGIYVMGISTRFYQAHCKSSRPVPYLRIDTLSRWINLVINRGCLRESRMLDILSTVIVICLNRLLW